MEPSTEHSPSTSRVEKERNNILLLTHSVQYAVQLLREEGRITDDKVTSFSEAEKELGKKLSNRILDAIDEMVLGEEGEVLHRDEIDGSEDFPDESISQDIMFPLSSKETSDEETVFPLSSKEKSDDETVSSVSSKESFEEYSSKGEAAKQHTVPWSVKVKAVTAAKLHPGWTWKTIQRTVTRQLRSSSQLSKWKKMVEKGGSTKKRKRNSL